MNEFLQQYFRLDPVHFMGFSEPLRLGMGRLIHADADGAVMEVKNMRFLTALNPGAARRLMPYLDGVDMACLFEEDLVKPLRDAGRYQNILPYHGVAYLKTERLPESVPAGVEIRRITESEAGFVNDHYEILPNYDYILSRIRAGLFGAYVDGKLAGFMGTHDEGSMGLLEVLPEYRRLHLGEALERRVVNDRLDRGYIPFGQVAPGNAASLGLQKKLGLTISDKTQYWLY